MSDGDGGNKRDDDERLGSGGIPHSERDPGGPPPGAESTGNQPRSGNNIGSGGIAHEDRLGSGRRNDDGRDPRGDVNPTPRPNTLLPLQEGARALNETDREGDALGKVTEEIADAKKEEPTPTPEVEEEELQRRFIVLGIPGNLGNENTLF